MILTRQAILSEIKRRRVIVDPLHKSAIGPASIDLSLGDEIRVFPRGRKPFVVVEDTDYRKETKKIKLGKGYLLKPGELILGITKEKITLPTDICGWLQSRSRFARLGLMSHITAPFVSPGVSNRQVLEIFNAGPRSLLIVPGIHVCQLVLQKCLGNAKYKGIFMDQEL